MRARLSRLARAGASPAFDAADDTAGPPSTPAAGGGCAFRREPRLPADLIERLMAEEFPGGRRGSIGQGFAGFPALNAFCLIGVYG